MNVKEPTSYNDLLTVNCVCQRICRKRGLLHCDNSLVECMLEASCYQMPYSLRRLFAMILVYCDPDNPRELWKQFEDSMPEDFRNLSNIMVQDIRLAVLNHINDVLHSMRHDMNEFNLVPKIITSSKITKEAK